MCPLTGITEAFKADSFDKKINLGTMLLPTHPASTPPPPTDGSIDHLSYIQVSGLTEMTRESHTSCPRFSRLRTRLSAPD